MQEDAELKIQEFFKTELDDLDMNIMDDEKESDDEDVNKCTNAKDLFKSSKTSTKSETLNEELSSINMEKNVLDQRTSYGADVYHSDASSERSINSQTPNSHRKSERLKTKASVTPTKQMSASDVTLLSDPSLLRKLAAFQGVGDVDDSTDANFLQNPRLLKALHNIQSGAQGDCEHDDDNLDFQLENPMSTSTPIYPIAVEKN